MIIWSFHTKRFTVMVDAIDEQELDLSWDDTGEVREKIGTGEYIVFCARARLFLDGIEIATDYLGQCIYTSPKEFRDHIESRGKWGSYFKDMVANVIADARKQLRDIPKLRLA